MTPTTTTKKSITEAARPGDAAYTSDPAYRADTENARTAKDIQDAAYSMDPAGRVDTTNPQTMTAQQASMDRIGDMTPANAAYVAERGVHEKRIETHGGDVAKVDSELTEEERKHIEDINR